jgi:phage gp36-like protein
MVMAMLAIGSRVELGASTQINREGGMAYCSLVDLQGAYGEDRIAGWSRCNPDTAEKAIADAGAEIDGYLLSGGYTVPLPGAPETVRKYCVDIAAANLVIGAGVLGEDPGGKGVIEHAKSARRFLEKVAEGKFRIPGYRRGSAEVSTPSLGGVRVRTRAKLDLRGY